jgi:hypothetical protein
MAVVRNMGCLTNVASGGLPGFGGKKMLASLVVDTDEKALVLPMK